MNTGFPPILPDDEANDPLLAALRARLYHHGQPPPPDTWAAVRAQLPQPVAVRRWWQRPRPLLLATVLPLVVLLSVLVMRYRQPQELANAATPTTALKKLSSNPKTASAHSTNQVATKALAPVAPSLSAALGRTKARLPSTPVAKVPEGASAARSGLFTDTHVPRTSASAGPAARLLARRTTLATVLPKRRGGHALHQVGFITPTTLAGNREHLLAEGSSTKKVATAFTSPKRVSSVGLATRRYRAESARVSTVKSGDSARRRGGSGRHVRAAAAGLASAIEHNNSFEQVDSLASKLVGLMPAPALSLPALAARPDSGRAHAPLRRWALLALVGPTLSYRLLGSAPAVATTTTNIASLERPALGLGAQVQVRRQLSGRWALAFGLGYQEYTTRLALSITDTASYTAVHQSDTYRLVVVPVQVGYALGVPRSRLDKFLLFGAEAGWYQGGQGTEGGSCSCQQQTYASAAASPYNRWSLALSLGLDLRYRVGGPTSRWRWLVQPTGRYVATPFVRSDALGYARRQPFSLGVLTGFSWDLR